jgi:hypothetical protein
MMHTTCMEGTAGTCQGLAHLVKLHCALSAGTSHCASVLSCGNLHSALQDDMMPGLD